jgi:hypothetical protein
MDYEYVLSNSPKGEEVREILAVCDRLSYPPASWKRAPKGESEAKVNRFLSVWEKLTGKSQEPADQGLPFSWSPEQLVSRSTELLAIHKAVIFKGLSDSEGYDKKIDLFKWFWKDVIEEYIDSVAGLPIPDELSNRELSYVPPDGSSVPDRETEPANYNVDNDVKEAVGIILEPGAFKEGLRRAWWTRNFYDDLAGRSHHTLGFATAFCRQHEVKEGEALNETALGKIQENEAVKLRLSLWWGWPSPPDKEAPFPCMQDIFVKHIAHMVEEGYLRQTNSQSPPPHGVIRQQDVREHKYRLTDAGKRGLEELDPGKKAGLAECVKDINLVDLGNLLSSVCAQLFPR